MSDANDTQDQVADRDGTQDDPQNDRHDATDGKSERDITLARLSDERREARSRAQKAETRLAELEAKQREADETKAKEDGKWQELAETREATLTTTTGERDTLKAELETLRGYVTSDIAGITKQVKDLKDDPAAKALLDFHPGDDASPAQLLAWAAKAKARLPEIAEAQSRTSTPVNGPNPKPATGAFDRESAIQRAKSSGRYTI